MKKLSALIFTLLLFHSSTLPVKANKCGVNIGPNYQQVSQAAGLTKNGGWVVILGTPGNCANFESLFGKGLNVVIRAYNNGQKFTNSQALGWVATLGKMETQGQKVFFMPWNEPNHSEECGGQSCTPTQVISYVNFLKDQLSAAGLLNSKVVLLSPMIDKLNPTFPTFQSVYNQGLGSSINEYDQAADPGNYLPCQASNPVQNNCRYNQIGIPAPYYALETGVAGTSTSYPAYRDNEISAMLSESWKYWSGDNNFQMFAVFSYDPHRTDWNLFSAPQTINFYQNNCSPGTISSGNFDPGVFQQWLSDNQNQLVSCGGCGYAPSKGFCTGAGKSSQPQEPEIIELQSSSVCADFDISQKSEAEAEATPSPGSGQVQGASAKDIQGNLVMESGHIFNFSGFEKNLSSALTRLLPAADQENLSIDSQPLQSKVKHYVSGEENGQKTKAEKPAESKITYPSWWTKLIGESRILCGLFNTCTPPKSLTIQVTQTIPEAPSEKIGCISGTNTTQVEPITVAPASGTESQFKTRASILETFLSMVPKIIGVIKKFFNITQTETQLANKTRANLTGGQNLNLYAGFMESWLPANLLPANKTSSLKGAAGYEVALSPPKDYQESLNYQNQGRNLARFCLQLCSLSPAGTDLSEYGCISCNVKDYQLTSAPVSNLPVPSQACSADKPYENIPSCTICQNILFCSGNNYRLCPTDAKIPAPALGSRNEGWWFSSGDFPDGIVLYNGEEFPVPSGGVYVCDSNVHGCVDPRCQ